MPYTVWIWSVSTLMPIAIISCCNQIKGIKWSKKENYLCIITGTERILFWKENGTIAECIFNFQHKKISIQKIKWSNDGYKALISDKN
jgi:WD40 repeat protein